MSIFAIIGDGIMAFWGAPIHRDDHVLCSTPSESGVPVLISFRTTSSGTNEENERSEVSNSATAVCSSLISLMLDDARAVCENVSSPTDRSSRNGLV
jgi:class 3 adenylate cyclase